VRFPRARSLSSVSRRLIYSPAPALLPAKREEDEAGRTGTRGHTHTCARHPALGGRKVLSRRALLVQRQSSLHRTDMSAVHVKPLLVRRILDRFPQHFALTRIQCEQAYVSLNRPIGERRRCPLLKCFRGNIIMFGSFPIAHVLIRWKCINCYINDGYNHWGYVYPAIAHCSNINPLWPSNISAVAMRICPMTVDIFDDSLNNPRC